MQSFQHSPVMLQFISEEYCTGPHDARPIGLEGNEDNPPAQTQEAEISRPQPEQSATQTYTFLEETITIREDSIMDSTIGGPNPLLNPFRRKANISDHVVEVQTIVHPTYEETCSVNQHSTSCPKALEQRTHHLIPHSVPSGTTLFQIPENEICNTQHSTTYPIDLSMRTDRTNPNGTLSFQIPENESFCSQQSFTPHPTDLAKRRDHIITSSVYSETSSFQTPENEIFSLQRFAAPYPRDLAQRTGRPIPNRTHSSQIPENESFCLQQILTPHPTDLAQRTDHIIPFSVHSGTPSFQIPEIERFTIQSFLSNGTPSFTLPSFDMLNSIRNPASLWGRLSLRDFQNFIHKIMIHGTTLTFLIPDTHSGYRQKTAHLRVELEHDTAERALIGHIPNFETLPWTIYVHLGDEVSITIHDSPLMSEPTVLANPLLELGLAQGGVSFKCPDCPFRGSSRYYLTAHYHTRHLKLVIFYCKICNFRSYYKSSVYRHLRNIHPESSERLDWLVQIPAICIGPEDCKVCKFIETIREIHKKKLINRFKQRIIESLRFGLVFHITRD